MPIAQFCCQHALYPNLHTLFLVPEEQPGFEGYSILLDRPIVPGNSLMKILYCIPYIFHTATALKRVTLQI